MRDFKYICFDLDGTLIQSGEGIKKSIEFVIDYYKLDREKIGDLNKFIGPPLVSSFEEFCGFNQDEVEEVIRVFRSDYLSKGQYNMQLYEGVSQLLQSLNEKGCKVALVTSKLKITSEEILKRFNIDKYFEYIAGSLPDNTMTDKQILLNSAIQYFNVKDKNQVVMIGDRKYDIIGANANDVCSIGVLYGYGTYEELSESKATYFAENINDLKILLKC